MKLKKIVALLLTLAVMLASMSMMCFSTSAVEVQTQINIPEGVSTYELNGVAYTVIRTAEEMNAAAAANVGGGVNYILANDLVYSDELPFTPISLKNGSFNGNGHSITGVKLVMTATDDYGIGMFTTSRSTGCTFAIYNLTVGAPENPVSVSTAIDAWKENGVCRIGALVGYLNATAVMENVTVYANVNAGANFRTGGLIAEARSKLTMKNCTFIGNVTAAAGAAANENICVGGLIGSTWSLNATIENCASYGAISYEGGYAAGLIGQMSNTLVLKNCANYATVSGGKSGGLIADSGLKVTGKVTMSNCFNAGVVHGTTYAAGLIGGCSKTSGYPTEVTNSANIGVVTSDALAADLIARIDAPALLTMTNCGSFGVADAFAISGKAADDANVTTTSVTAAEALAFMQTNCGFAMFGIEDSMIDVKTVPAEAKFLQYKKDAATNKMDIRVIGVINTADLAKYANVGFNVSVYQAGENGADPVLLKTFEPQTTTTVYSSVRANEGNTITEYSAADLGATYLYTLELRSIPMTGSYVFKITAFATESDANSTVTTDAGITVTVVNGEIQ